MTVAYQANVNESFSKRMVQSTFNFLKKHKTILQILFSCVLIWFVFFKVNVKGILSHISHINLWWYLVCLILNMYIIWGQSMRWRDLLKPGQTMNVPRLYFVWLTLEGYFFNFFLPSSIGGDVVKSYKMGNFGLGKLNALSATVLARIFGILVLCVFFWMSLLFFSVKINTILLIIMIIVSIMSTGALVFVVCHFDNVITNKFGALKITMERYRNEWKLFGTTLLKTVILQIFVLLTQYAYFKCINIDIGFEYLLLYVPLVNIVTMFPLSFNGIGIREWIIIETFAKIPGITVEICLASTAIAYSIVFIQAGMGAICYMLPIPASWRMLSENKLRKD